jgi:preprotein translocase subunit SecD
MIFAGLFLACSVWATDEKPTLAFYVVSPKMIEGGRFIDTKAFPKLGHITAKPELVIAVLKEARLIKQPGDRPNILITLHPNQVDQLADFTGKNIGKKILLMLDNEPLIAPRVLEQIRTPALQISLSDQQKRIRILEALKRLVGKPKH